MTKDHRFKRIVVLCDGTWMSSIGEKGAGPQSNVTRMARCLKRKCHDGTPQVIVYDPGVGSSASKVDQWFGGAFGMGLEQNIREMYNFICNNFVDGDEIILIGFSRGAFTARSVADLIGTIGLLTPEGQDYFNSIFKDYENIADTDRDLDKYLTKLDPFVDEGDGSKAEWVAKRKRAYVKFLKGAGYVRGILGNKDEPEVKIKAIAVWDTVGTLGIPPAPLMGIRGSADQFKFSDTKLSARVENAFQALALDEPRFAFRPALWERTDDSPTNLKQVWFPGNHGGVGGGWWDQSMSDITLAWMVDQLTPLGIEFEHGELTQTFSCTLAYLAAHPFPYRPPQIWLPTHHYVDMYLPFSWWWAYFLPRHTTPWARAPIYHPPRPGQTSNPVRDYNDCPAFKHTHELPTTEGGPAHPGRPWALGQLRFPDSFVQCFVGSWVRTPGMTRRVDPSSNKDLENQPLHRTAERIHSSVRVRLACEGLGWDDRGKWECKALTGNPTNGVRWRLVREKSEAVKSSTTSEASTPSASASSPSSPFPPASASRAASPGTTTNGTTTNGAATTNGTTNLNGANEINPCGCVDSTPSDSSKRLYAVEPTDCDWKWVYINDPSCKQKHRLRNLGHTIMSWFRGPNPPVVEPDVLELPEEPLDGYWERYLLGVNCGGEKGQKGEKGDVWSWALGNPPVEAMS